VTLWFQALVACSKSLQKNDLSQRDSENKDQDFIL